MHTLAVVFPRSPHFVGHRRRRTSGTWCEPASVSQSENCWNVAVVPWASQHALHESCRHAMAAPYAAPQPVAARVTHRLGDAAGDVDRPVLHLLVPHDRRRRRVRVLRLQARRTTTVVLARTPGRLLRRWAGSGRPSRSPRSASPCRRPCFHVSGVCQSGWNYDALAGLHSAGVAEDDLAAPFRRDCPRRRCPRTEGLPRASRSGKMLPCEVPLQPHSTSATGTLASATERDERAHGERPIEARSTHTEISRESSAIRRFERCEESLSLDSARSN